MPNELAYAKGNVSPKELASLYHEAEKTLKKYERIHEECLIPAINQLRYAGCHLTRYLKDESNNDELIKAANHCRRAIFDVYEAAIYFHLTEINAFEADFSNVVISEVVSDWPKLRQSINKIRREVNELYIEKYEMLDDHNNDELYNQNYKKYEEYFEELYNIVELLKNARDDLNKKGILQRKKDKYTFFGLGLTIVAIIISVLFYFLSNGK